jgi:hypothetical protein
VDQNTAFRVTAATQCAVVEQDHGEGAFNDAIRYALNQGEACPAA